MLLMMFEIDGSGDVGFEEVICFVLIVFVKCGLIVDCIFCWGFFGLCIVVLNCVVLVVWVGMICW